VSPSALERQLKQYYKCPKQTLTPFDLKQVPNVSVAPQTELKRNDVDFGLIDHPPPNNVDMESSAIDRLNPGTVSARQQERYIAELSQIPLFATLGPLLKSSPAVELTESDLEYFVTCVKHIYRHNVVLQFNCTNTMKNIVLKDIEVDVQAQGFEVEGCIPCSKLEYDVVGKIYVVLKYSDDPQMCMTTVGCKLIYKVLEIGQDGDEEEAYEDEYPLENLDINISDSIVKILKTNFAAAWEELGLGCELSQLYSFDSIKTIDEMVKKLEELGLNACDGSGTIDPSKSSHVLLLAGKFRGGQEVLINCKIVKGVQSAGVNIQFTVRCQDNEIGTLFQEVLG